MFRCHICGSQQAQENLVNEVFHLGDKPVLVEHIPAMVCIHCGEITFSRQTTEQIRQMVHSKVKPTKTISIDVFDFFKKAS